LADITIRPLAPSDAAAFRALRFDALQQYPASFATSVSEWTILTIGEVADMLIGHNEKLVFGAFGCGAEGDMPLVGVVGFLRQAKDKYRHKASVWGMYVQSEWQGRGIARMLLKRVIDHARTQSGLDQILLTVTEGNQGARSLYEGLGFRVYGVEPKAIDPGDGHRLDEILMMLDLRSA
jgi:ribosomal protein S18 acetylase RimI-like enzyme